MGLQRDGHIRVTEQQVKPMPWAGGGGVSVILTGRLTMGGQWISQTRSPRTSCKRWGEIKLPTQQQCELPSLGQPGKLRPEEWKGVSIRKEGLKAFEAEQTACIKHAETASISVCLEHRVRWALTRDDVELVWAESRQDCELLDDCCFSVTKSCPIPWDLMNCSTPGSYALHYLLEFAQIHVYWVSEAISSSNHLFLCRCFLLPSIFPSIRVFSSELPLHIRWPKYWWWGQNLYF